MKKIFKSVATWIIIIEILMAIFMWILGFRITYGPELDNNWDAISAVAEWAGVIIGAIIIPLVVMFLQHKWDSDKKEIALSNLVTTDQLEKFERRFAPLLNEQKQEGSVKPELPLREQQLLQFLSVNMGANKKEISEQLGISAASTQRLIERLLKEGKIESHGMRRSQVYKVARK